MLFFPSCCFEILQINFKQVVIPFIEFLFTDFQLIFNKLLYLLLASCCLNTCNVIVHMDIAM